MKKVYYVGIVVVLGLLFTGRNILFSSGPGDDYEEPPKKQTPPTTELEKGWVYGQIEYLHDVLAPNEYFMKLHDYPSDGLGVPEVYGGYATTDVYVTVKLRGVATPRALQEEENRARPPIYLDRERRRWNDSMQYVWNLMEPTKTFRVGNMEVLEENVSIEADINVMLGGQWMPLGILMVNDHYAAAEQPGVDWDFGAREMAPLNPNVPK